MKSARQQHIMENLALIFTMISLRYFLCKGSFLNDTFYSFQAEHSKIFLNRQFKVTGNNQVDSKVCPFLDHSCAILSCFKIVLFLNKTSDETKPKSADALNQLNIAQLCSKNGRTLVATILLSEKVELDAICDLYRFKKGRKLVGKICPLD